MSFFFLVEDIDRRSFRQWTRLTRSWRKFHRSRSVVFHQTDKMTNEQPSESKHMYEEKKNYRTNEYRPLSIMHEDEG